MKHNTTATPRKKIGVLAVALAAFALPTAGASAAGSMTVTHTGAGWVLDSDCGVGDVTWSVSTQTGSEGGAFVGPVITGLALPASATRVRVTCADGAGPDGTAGGQTVHLLDDGAQLPAGTMQVLDNPAGGWTLTASCPGGGDLSYQYSLPSGNAGGAVAGPVVIDAQIPAEASDVTVLCPGGVGVDGESGGTTMPLGSPAAATTTDATTTTVAATPTTIGSIGGGGDIGATTTTTASLPTAGSHTGIAALAAVLTAAGIALVAVTRRRKAVA